MTGRTLAMIGIVGPVSYVVLVTVLGFLWPGYDPIRQTQSELGAVDAPLGPVMNVAGFIALGLVVLAFAGVYLLVLRRGGWALAAVAALVVAGVGLVVVGFFPCDAGCVDVTRTGELHSFFSMPPAIGLPVAMMLSAAAFREDGRLGASWQAASFALGALGLAAGPVIAAELAAGYDGLLQRVAMWVPVLWVSAVSLRLHAFTGEAKRDVDVLDGRQSRAGGPAAADPANPAPPGDLRAGQRGRLASRDDNPTREGAP
jgi:hypothetical membrane protein